MNYISLVPHKTSLSFRPIQKRSPLVQPLRYSNCSKNRIEGRMAMKICPSDLKLIHFAGESERINVIIARST